MGEKKRRIVEVQIAGGISPREWWGKLGPAWKLYVAGVGVAALIPLRFMSLTGLLGVVALALLFAALIRSATDAADVDSGNES